MPTQQTPAATTPVAAVPSSPSPAAIYEALANQKSVLRGQLEELTEQRSDLVREVGNASASGISGAARTGMEERIAALDKRIAGVDQEMALVDAQVAKAAA